MVVDSLFSLQVLRRISVVLLCLAQSSYNVASIDIESSRVTFLSVIVDSKHVTSKLTRGMGYSTPIQIHTLP